jgi:hypothetical protein
MRWVAYGSAPSERFVLRTVTADADGEPITPGVVELTDEDTGERWCLDAAAAAALAAVLTTAARKLGTSR